MRGLPLSVLPAADLRRVALT